MKARYFLDVVTPFIDFFFFQQVFCHCGQVKGRWVKTESLNHTVSGDRQTAELVKSFADVRWKLNLDLPDINQVEYD